MPRVTRQTTITRSDEFIAALVDDELMMMSLEQGQYYVLNGISTQIWELLANPIKVLDLCAKLLEKYHVTNERCEADVLAFLSELLKADMILIVDEDAEETA
jgi:hypothetical protein